MGQILHDWIIGMTATSLLAACAQTLSPKGAVEKVTGFVCSLMLTAALVSPLMELEPDSFSWSASAYRRTVTQITADLADQQNRLLCTHIENQCAAYILDEARALGVSNGEAEVSAKWSDENWMPYEASLTMCVTPDQKQKLSSWLTAQLGIPAERQRWNEG